jgi:oligopeptide/dipeptide ABC transporter ATP-binding protein
MVDDHAALSASGISKEFTIRNASQSPFTRASKLRAVDDVDIELAAGEIVALVGESGSGKTTLGRILARLEDATTGSLLLSGSDITSSRGRRAKAVHRLVQMIFQNPYESLNPRHSVSRAVTEPLSIHGLGSSAERRRRAAIMLEAVGLTPVDRYLNSFPDELSGGQRQRVAIARAMVLDPRVLIADEPISMLDASIRSSILNTMVDLRDRFGLSILFISHDLASARYVSSRLLVMYKGKIVESGPTDDVIAAPAHPYTRFLIAASSRQVGVPLDLPNPRPSRACGFAPRCPLNRELCWTIEPPLVEVRDRHASLCHFANEVVDLDNLGQIGEREATIDQH